MKYYKGIFFLIVCVVYASAAKVGTYNDKYDKIDLEAVIRNDRLLKNYVDCLLDKVTCRPDGLELKRTLPDALHTDCRKCTETQKKGTTIILRHLIKNKRPWWNELEAKYDPQRIYVNKYSTQLKEAGVLL